MPERKTVKTSVSLDRDILPAAKARAKQLGFGKSFSSYLVKLIEDDCAEGLAAQVTARAAEEFKRPNPGTAADSGHKLVEKVKKSWRRAQKIPKPDQ